MKLLLDTHAVLWASRRPESLSKAARSVLADPHNERILSAVAAWELSIKAASGKLPEALPLLAAYDQAVTALVARELPITRRHAIFAGQLPWDHKDPFDRMLAAQAILEGLTILTKDTAFGQAPGVNTFW